MSKGTSGFGPVPPGNRSGGNAKPGTPASKGPGTPKGGNVQQNMRRSQNKAGGK